ncbi:MAG: hypothetical protein ACPIOQ_05170, partial [Promethearchaeia archaeon]
MFSQAILDDQEQALGQRHAPADQVAPPNARAPHPASAPGARRGDDHAEPRSGHWRTVQDAFHPREQAAGVGGDASVSLLMRVGSTVLLMANAREKQKERKRESILVRP